MVLSVHPALESGQGILPFHLLFLFLFTAPFLGGGGWLLLLLLGEGLADVPSLHQRHKNPAEGVQGLHPHATTAALFLFGARSRVQEGACVRQQLRQAVHFTQVLALHQGMLNLVDTYLTRGFGGPCCGGGRGGVLGLGLFCARHSNKKEGDACVVCLCG